MLTADHRVCRAVSLKSGWLPGRGTRRSQLLSVTRWIEASVRGLAAVDVRDFASDLGIHPDFSAGVLDGQ
jgi:hypothetical protein